MTLKAPEDPGDLVVGQDLRFQRRMWLVQRVGWTSMLLVVLAGLGGLLGGEGILAEARATSDDGRVSVDFDRFSRHGYPTQVEISVARGLLDDGRLTVWVGRDWLSGIDVRRVEPEPEGVVDAGAFTGFTVRAEPGAEGPVTILVSVEYDDVWFRRGDIRVSDSEVSLDQLIFP